MSTPQFNFLRPRKSAFPWLPDLTAAGLPVALCTLHLESGAYFGGVLKELTEQLAGGKPLTEEQVRTGVAQLTDERVAVEVKAEFLTALARKGETPEEIGAFACELRQRALLVPVDAATRAEEILDVVGTGGDRLGTFNISTCAALIAAAAGVRVAKHGNRAVTSKTGSADVIETLGLPIELTPDQAAARLREHGFVFLFAPRFHPAFRHIGPARKLCAERGQRTIFNILGPLLNPALPSASLVGVPRPELCEPMARAFRQLNLRRVMVVSGRVTVGPRGTSDYLDEFSTLGETTVAEFYHDRGFNLSSFSPAPLPIQPASLKDLSGGDRFDNARIVREVLAGKDRGPRRDAVLLNAGAALFVAGRTRTIAEGWQLAGEVIDRGDASRKLEALSAASP
jgi:anthranilate phosphoribosyltransferase